jgi:hypothetical protein
MEQSMPNTTTFFVAGIVLVFVTVAARGQTSSAPPSAELAKKCREMAVKAHPPSVAGSAKGTAQVEREYFKKCIEGGGKVQN